MIRSIPFSQFLVIAGLSVALVGLVSAAGPEAIKLRPVHTGHLLEPSLRLAVKSAGAPEVALTFDACMGKVDHRILDMLVGEKIPATIFVTARWLKRNPDAFTTMKAYPELFEIEDHGANHVPAVEQAISIYGIKAAGSPEAVASEVAGGADAIVSAGGARPLWFRGATAKYSARSIAQIEAMGYRIAGYSVNGDGGSLLGDRITEKRIASARDGDVIIAHINQPEHKAGDGVVRGVLDLKKRGYKFVLLRDQPEKMGKLVAK